MSRLKAVHCIVDDTALTTNINEIEEWILQGAVTLVIPLYTLERLHILKKDASLIGQNARKTVKFLDRMTSGKTDLPHEPIIIQGPDEQYATWQEVETHYNEAGAPESSEAAQRNPQPPESANGADTAAKRTSNSGGALSQMLLDKLNFAEPAAGTSPGSSPPTSPASSEPQSSKTSPEVKTATIAAADKSPVPPSLKPLLNPVVWYIHEKRHDGHDVVFLTNSADIHHLARDFKVTTKTIHQLRSDVGPLDPSPATNTVSAPTHRKQRSIPSLADTADNEPRGLFSYDDESEEEEVVFKPRGRGAVRGTAGRGSHTGSMRSRNGPPRSPRPSFGSNGPNNPAKPQIPIEEIDPDSFDRGSFGRGSVPLANTGPSNHGHHIGTQFSPASRGSPRGGFGPVGAHRGFGYYRGPRGMDRGSARGRGRLFVP